MTTAPPVLRHVCRLLAAQSSAILPDHQLLQRFVSQQDEGAFEALVLRHGSMVLGVCRRVLRHEQDAEDAFQATFLVFARKAGSIRKQGSLSSWLHAVAQRLGWTRSTFRKRLERGRDLLRHRLARCGLTLSAGLFPTLLAGPVASAAL